MTNTNFTVGMGKAWMDGGIDLKAAPDSAGALAAMAADFDVKLEPIQVIGGNTVADRFAVVRQDTLDPLEVVGTKYTTLQNRDAAKICDSLVASGEALYETGQCMEGGRRMWILMRRPASFSVVAGDTVESFINVVNSHDGQTSLTLYATSVRTVSKATLNVYSHRDTGAVRIRHTKGIANPADLVAAVGMVKKEFQELEAAAKVLAGKQLTQAQLDAFFAAITPKATGAVPVQRSVATMEDILSYFHHGTGNGIAGVTGTAWGLFNGLVEWIDYAAPTKSKLRTPAEQRMKSQLFGDNRKLKQKAFELLLRI